MQGKLFMRCAIALPFVLSLSLSAASVDGLNIHSSITGKGSKTVGGPNGRAAREAMMRGFFVADTTSAVQTKVLNMMLGAPEATAKTQSLNTASSLTKITERVRSQRTSGSTNRIRTLNRLVNGRPQLAGLSAYPDFGFSVGAAIYNRNLR
jgi:hypothetical protein